MKSFFKKLDSGTVRIQEFIAGMGLIAATLIIVFNSVARYFFAASVVWAEEAVRYIIVWSVMMGTSLAIRHNVHVKVDVLHVRLPLKAEKVLLVFTYFLGLFFCLFLIWSGYQHTRQLMHTGQFSTAMLWLQMWYVTIAIPIFGVLGSKDFAQLIVLNLLRKGEIVRTVGVTLPPVPPAPVEEKDEKGGEAK